MRLYGFEHKRTEAQFETAWNELQAALPRAGDAGFLLGVSGNKLLLDGIPLESGQAERSFAQLLREFQMVRAASIAFFETLTRQEWLRRGTVNGYSASVRGLAFHMAGHELHHMRIVR